MVLHIRKKRSVLNFSDSARQDGYDRIVVRVTKEQKEVPIYCTT
ncbi:unnamed protein product [Amoebophrya sp. A120]|nr:unnamed protein product [Amoebophrya sp. A120]|eukprot:GSA120T00007579001.1